MDQWDKAIDMRGHGANWSEIERATGLSLVKLRLRLDPEYRAKRAEMHRRDNASPFRAVAGIRVEHRFSPEEAARALASIPRDTRSFTARAFGDPILERSALYRKHGGTPDKGEAR